MRASPTAVYLAKEESIPMNTIRALSASALALVGALAFVACSSSSNNTSNNSLPASCTNGGSSHTSQACGDCMQANCSAEYNACFGSGGQCSTWINGGCQGLPDSTCMSCVQKGASCEDAHCSAQCKSTTSDAGTQDTGGSDGGGMNCATLAACCTQLDGGAMSGCDSVVSSGNDAQCKSTLDGFKAAGMCH